MTPPHQPIAWCGCVLEGRCGWRYRTTNTCHAVQSEMSKELSSAHSWLRKPAATGHPISLCRTSTKNNNIFRLFCLFFFLSALIFYQLAILWQIKQVLGGKLFVVLLSLSLLWLSCLFVCLCCLIVPWLVFNFQTNNLLVYFLVSLACMCGPIHQIEALLAYLELLTLLFFIAS